MTRTAWSPPIGYASNDCSYCRREREAEEPQPGPVAAVPTASPQAPAAATHVLFWEPAWPGAEYGQWRAMPLQDWEDGAGYDTSEAVLETIPGTEPSAEELLAWLRREHPDGPGLDAVELQTGTYRYIDRHHDGSPHERDLPTYTVTTRTWI
ncbi:hypothetical protein [Kitasatospora sp. HPMI-4]|uniref:hypothetical protein n=1 Tax=Kitasatospora sp. HPMI-4 TaxID=3448443 RepID=UPI003F1D2BF0